MADQADIGHEHRDNRDQKQRRCPCRDVESGDADESIMLRGRRRLGNIRETRVLFRCLDCFSAEQQEHPDACPSAYSSPASDITHLAPMTAAFPRKITRSTSRYRPAGKVDNADSRQHRHPYPRNPLTSDKHRHRHKRPMLGLKSFQQRRQRQRVHQHMEKSLVYKHICVQSMHCQTTISIHIPFR